MAQFELPIPFLPTPRVSKTRPTTLFYAAHGDICKLNVRYRIGQQKSKIAVFAVSKNGWISLAQINWAQPRHILVRQSTCWLKLEAGSSGMKVRNVIPLDSISSPGWIGVYTVWTGQMCTEVCVCVYIHYIYIYIYTHTHTHTHTHTRI